MSAISITDLSENSVSKCHYVSEKSVELVTPTKKVAGRRGQVVHKTYVLNDTSALKKKMRHEDRKEVYNLGVEARDGSNMVIETRTSFFEHIKAQFIDDLLRVEGIETVDNALAAKAATENSGGAIVEYSLDITFKVKDEMFTIKITAYTTSCRLMFQPVGGNPQTRIQPGSKSIPRYFVDTFFLQEECL